MSEPLTAEELNQLAVYSAERDREPVAQEIQYSAIHQSRSWHHVREDDI